MKLTIPFEQILLISLLMILGAYVVYVSAMLGLSWAAASCTVILITASIMVGLMIGRGSR